MNYEDTREKLELIIEEQTKLYDRQQLYIRALERLERIQLFLHEDKKSGSYSIYWLDQRGEERCNMCIPSKYKYLVTRMLKDVADLIEQDVQDEDLILKELI